MADRQYSIKILAEKLEVVARTIKSWEQKGLIDEARRNKWGHREYTDSEIEKIVEYVKSKNYFQT